MVTKKSTDKVILAIVAVAFLRSNSNGVLPPSQDDLSELFSSSDVFQSEGSGK